MPNRIQQSLTAVRLLVAATMFIHGTYRLLAGGVAPFGGFLNASNIPFGTAAAWAITIFEITASVAVALGFAVRPLAIAFAIELGMGIALVHSRAGWFVVGGGRNGMEYSVLLIGLFLALAWAHSKRENP